MKRFVAKLNIEHYREALATEKNEEKRQALIRLLAEEEERLAALDKEKKENRI